MTKNIFQFIVLSLVLMLAQVVCNKILIFNLAMPMVFIYILLRMPITWHNNICLTIAFFLGLMVDIFNNTPGMHALACIVLVGLRRSVFNAYVPRETELTDPFPSVKTLGTAVYLKYMTTLVLIYCTVVFFVQVFTLRDFTLTLARIGASSLLTAIIFFGLDTLVSTKREKRL